MPALRFLLRWGCVLGVALVAPVALPAGGAYERAEYHIRRCGNSGPILAGKSCLLRVSPFLNAPSLRRIELGTPLRMLSSWESPKGKQWLRVQIVSRDIFGKANRLKGWVNV